MLNIFKLCFIGSFMKKIADNRLGEVFRYEKELF